MALNYSPALLGLSITLFIVIGVLVGSIYLLYRQITAYKDDVSNYQVLRGGDDDDKAMNPLQRTPTVV